MQYAPPANMLGSYVYDRLRSNQRSNQRPGTSRTVTSNKRKRKQLTSSIKQVITNEKPAKHRTFFDSEALTHNTIYTLSPTQAVVQGDTNENRDGDQIQVCALKLKGSFYAPATANGYSYRFLVGYSGEEYSVAAAFSASGLVDAEIFLPVTSGGHRTNGIINPKAFTVLHDETIDVNSLLTSVQDVYSYQMLVSLNDAKFPYQSSGSIYGKTRNLYVVVIGCAIGGSTGITDAGVIHLSADLIFK